MWMLFADVTGLDVQMLRVSTVRVSSCTWRVVLVAMLVHNCHPSSR